MFGVNAADEGLQMEQQWSSECEEKCSSKRKGEIFSYRGKQTEGEDRANMKKEENMEVMRRYKGKCDIFCGIEHRLRKEDMEEQF